MTVYFDVDCMLQEAKTLILLVNINTLIEKIPKRFEVSHFYGVMRWRHLGQIWHLTSNSVQLSIREVVLEQRGVTSVFSESYGVALACGLEGGYEGVDGGREVGDTGSKCWLTGEADRRDP